MLYFDKEYDGIHSFIDHINDFSDEEVYLKMDEIICFLRENCLLGLEEKIKELAIKKIENLNMKLDLINKYYVLEDKDLKYCVNWKRIMDSMSNLNEDDKIIILRQLFLDQSFTPVLHLLNVPRNIKFGIELEYFGVSYEQMQELFDNGSIRTIMKALQIPNTTIEEVVNNSDFEKENEFDKWIFSKEHSDILPEASTPIMKNRLDCLNQLKSICLLFNALGAKTHGGTGMHINIGVDYFKGKLSALKYLLLIWEECEELFFKIANQENEEIRVCADSMAIPIKENIQMTFDEDATFSLNDQEDMNRFMYNIQVRKRLSDMLGFSHGDLEVKLSSAQTEEEKYNIFKKYLNEKEKTDTSIRYTSVNFNHVSWNNDDKGRIEFRLFNSSLDFETVIENLLLVCKLFEASLALANYSEDKQQCFGKLLNRSVTEEEKLNLLLDLLFDSEKEKDIFRRRWFSVKDKSSYERFSTGIETFRPAKKPHHKNS